MPNKLVNNLKNPILRQTGQEWQEEIGIYDLTTNEVDEIVDLKLQGGLSNNEAREEILKRRRQH